jgi:hypothetical protein
LLTLDSRYDERHNPAHVGTDAPVNFGFNLRCTHAEKGPARLMVFSSSVQRGSFTVAQRVIFATGLNPIQRGAAVAHHHRP